jgi:uncharacterized damage-inducible protein DinB
MRKLLSHRGAPRVDSPAEPRRASTGGGSGLCFCIHRDREAIAVKELFVAYARYNRKANEAVYSLMAKMGSEALRAPAKAYYTTILDTVFHVLKSDLKWLGRLSSFRASAIGAGAAAAYMSGDSADPARIAEGLAGFTDLRSRVDAEIIALIMAIPAEAFSRDFEIPFGDKRITCPLWQLLMQWFNHHTHHRGQASLFLDAAGVENDYSGVLDKIG